MDRKPICYFQLDPSLPVCCSSESICLDNLHACFKMIVSYYELVIYTLTSTLLAQLCSQIPQLHGMETQVRAPFLF